MPDVRLNDRNERQRLLAYVTVLRGNGFPIALVTAAYLLIRRVGWRAIAAGITAFAIPVLWYVLSFHAACGQYNITSSDGLFLWSRTTTFANCAIIKPPANLVPLCPDKAVLPPVKVHPTSTPALVKGPTPANYLWAPDAWWRHDAQPGFNAYNDKLGMQFALAAIRAQPLAYLRASAKDAIQLLLTNDRPQNTDAMAFTRTPRVPVLPAVFGRDIANVYRERIQYSSRPAVRLLPVHLSASCLLPWRCLFRGPGGRAGRNGQEMAAMGRPGGPALGPRPAEHRAARAAHAVLLPVRPDGLAARLGGGGLAFVRARPQPAPAATTAPAAGPGQRPDRVSLPCPGQPDRR